MAAAAVLQQEARERWPAEFAGLWLDSGAIWIAFTSDAESKVGELAELVPEHHDLRADDADRSLQYLEGLKGEIVRDRTALQEGRAPADMPSEIRATRGVYDASIHVQTQAIIVGVERVDAELRQEFLDYYGVGPGVLRFREGVGEPGIETS